MFYPKNIEIPADGETLVLDLGGCAVCTAEMGVYSTPQQVPKLYFEDEQNSPQHLYPISTYVQFDGFDRIVIEGTSESAGDDLFLMISDVPMEQEINILFTSTRRATLIPTFSYTMDDTVQTLATVDITNSEGDLPSKIYISAQGNDIRYAFDADPVQGGFGFLLSADQDPVEVDGINFIQALRVINNVNGEAPDLIVQCEY